MATRIQLRRDTSSNWVLANPVLALGELGLETNTLRIKVGDGLNNWNTLDYISDPAGLSVQRSGDTMEGSLFIDVDSVDDALRITQAGSGNALVVEDSSTPDTTPFVVKADGKVGIGTTAPSSPLEINSTSNNNVYIRSGNSAIAGIIFGKQDDPETASIQIRHDTNEFRISGFNNAPRLSIDSAGRVGIGTITPDSYANLDTIGTIQTSSTDPAIFFKETDQGTDEKMWRVSTTDGDFNIDALNDARTLASSAIKIVRSSAQNIDHIRFGVADGTEVLRITSDGRIGINTNTPDTTVDIRDSASSSNLTIGGSGQANVMKLATGSADSLAIFTNVINERVRITAAGLVGIGSTSPASIFHVQAADNTSTNEILRTVGNSSAITQQRANGTSASMSPIFDDEVIGSVTFAGFDGTNFIGSARISGVAAGNYGTSDTASRLEFYTTPALSSTPIKRMDIDENGLITGTGTSLGAWTSYDPTYSATSGTLTTVTTQWAQYTRIGKTVTVQAQFTIVDVGTATNNIVLTLPVSSARSDMMGFGREQLLTGKGVSVFGSGTTSIALRFVDNTATAATGYQFTICITYEAA